MHTTRCQSHSERQTADIAADLARRLPGGTVVLLFGDLGAGKTAFVRGFVEGAGIDPDEVSSPTFTIVQAYGGGRVQHVDLYRLGPAETDDLGLEELPEGGALVCIEWADRLPRPVQGAVSVRIHDLGGDSRELVIDLPGGLDPRSRSSARITTSMIIGVLTLVGAGEAAAQPEEVEGTCSNYQLAPSTATVSSAGGSGTLDISWDWEAPPIQE